MTGGEGKGGGERPLVFVVVGTRPEAIKMAPVLEALRARDDEVEARLVLTGQHDELVKQVLDVFGLDADHDLAIMKPGQSLYDVATRCLEEMGGLLRRESPSEVLVQGDTATVFFASLAAFFEEVRVGHVEAGLRSGDKWSPFPEEIFRRLSDVLADHYFAPTPVAAEHLRNEGVPVERIFLTGNPVVDALEEIRRRVGSEDGSASAGDDGDPRRGPEDSAGGRPLILLTAHRRESFGKPLEDVFRAVLALLDRFPDHRVVFPVHPNPNVRGPALDILGGHPRITLLDPVPYLDLVRYMARAELILTDSGGIQEEAPAFGVPVLVLRDVTERPEGVEAGAAVVVGTDPVVIVAEAEKVLDARRGRGMGSSPQGADAIPNPYGDGHAGERIADIVISDLTGAPRRTSDWRPGGAGGRGSTGAGA